MAHYGAPGDGGGQQPAYREPMPFDRVYSHAHEGMDTRSQIRPEHMGGSAPPTQRGPSALLSAGSAMMGSGYDAGYSPAAGLGPPAQPHAAAFGGQSTRSQLTSANFGGDGGGAPPQRNAGRFAGRSTQSSISLANFGGSSEPEAPRRTRRAYQAPPAPFAEQGGPSPASMYMSPCRYGPPQPQPQPQPQPRQQPPPQYQEGPASPQAMMAPESVLSRVSPQQVERMIREIAELRVRNGELEGQVQVLQQRLRVYEP